MIYHWFWNLFFFLIKEGTKKWRDYAQMTCRIDSIFNSVILLLSLNLALILGVFFNKDQYDYSLIGYSLYFGRNTAFHSLKDKAPQDPGWKGFNANCKLFALNVTIETCWKLNYCFWKYMKNHLGWIRNLHWFELKWSVDLNHLSPRFCLQMLGKS